MTETALIVAASSLASLVISRLRCILRPGQQPCFQSGCTESPLESKGDGEITVHKESVGGHEVLVVCQNKE